MHGCLHLKTAITRVSRDALLVNREWIDVAPFAGWTLIDVEEPFGANALLIGETLIHPQAYPQTRALLMHPSLPTEGGVTCCSLIVRNAGVPAG